MARTWVDGELITAFKLNEVSGDIEDIQETVEGLVAYDDSEPTNPLETNADQLDGHSSSYFATKSELTQLREEVEELQSIIEQLRS